MHPMATREEIQIRIREGKPLEGLRLRGVLGERARLEATDEDRRRVAEVLGEEAAKGRIVPFVVATERRADDGHVIRAAGWQVERYAKNPVVLWGHGHPRMPRIADSVAWVDGDKLRAVAAFMPKEFHELAWSLGEIAATRGHAASVGWETMAAVPAPDAVRKELPWALDITTASLLEWSLVNVGADEDALAGARASGVDVSPVARALAQAIDEATSRGDKAALERMWAAVADPARQVVVDQVPPRPAPVAPSPTITPDQVRAAVAAAFGSQLP